MKKLTALLPLVVALPAHAHETGPIAHLHPHGPDIAALAAIGVVALAYVVWKVRQRR
ncbi:hypothetical protein [Aliiruegeria sabulilitoris]|uniref:hypothetical protein n=1 Tax=Aliiruegeria sabulilitoris TaxID=1510458 RepID=UPI0012E37441|nr:hypothetical protein [Aliiruegeria sabulilitoris]